MALLKNIIFWFIIFQRLIQELPGHLHQWLIKLGDSLHHRWYPCPLAAAAGTENNQPSNPVNKYTMPQPIDYKNNPVFLSQALYIKECSRVINPCKDKRVQREGPPVFNNSCQFCHMCSTFCCKLDVRKIEGCPYSAMSDHKLQSQGLVTTLIGKLFWPLSGNYHLIGTADTIQSIFLKVKDKYDDKIKAPWWLKFRGYNFFSFVTCNSICTNVFACTATGLWAG